MPPKRKSPLFFLPPPDRAWLRERLQAPNNLDWLLTILCRYTRDYLWRVFPPPNPSEVTPDLVRLIGQALLGAVLRKLRRHASSRDARRPDATLVRLYPDRAGALVQQALTHLVNRWIRDVARQRRDSLASRCQRLLPSLGRLPNLRGKSVLDPTSRLFFLWVYDEALRLLKPLPPASTTTQTVRRRKEVLREAFNDLTAITSKVVLDSHPLFHPVSGEFFFEISDKDYEHWAFLPKQEIALEAALRAVKGLPGLTADYLRRILPRLRTQARLLDRALAPA